MIKFYNNEVLLTANEARLVGEFLLDLENTSAPDFMQDDDIEALNDLINNLTNY